jgi:hypothetical protein
MASRLDLPTPEPANSPRRWPWRQVAKQFSARIPRSSRTPRRARAVAPGGAASTDLSSSPTGSGPRLSSGRASGSSTRPSQPSDTASVPLPFEPTPRSSKNAELPGPSPSRAPNGIVCASPRRKPTTSAGTRCPSRADKISLSPTETRPPRPSTSTISPERPVTWPSSTTGAISRSLAAHAALRSRNPMYLIETLHRIRIGLHAGK